ncbi:unnamed protein product, partial [Symbiodinium sp. KB8]
ALVLPEQLPAPSRRRPHGRRVPSSSAPQLGQMRQEQQRDLQVLTGQLASMQRCLDALVMHAEKLTAEKDDYLAQSDALQERLRNICEPNLTDLDVEVQISIPGGYRRFCLQLLSAEQRWRTARDSVISQWADFQALREELDWARRVEQQFREFKQVREEQKKVLAAARARAKEVQAAGAACSRQAQVIEELKGRIQQASQPLGQDVHLDSILSGASGTSAHQHNKGTLNYMKAFLEARRCGFDLADASASFWVPGVIQRGMLIKALKLREVELCFRGNLPPETIDETSVAKNPPRWEAEDVLTDGESSKALVMDMGKPLLHRILVDFSQVACYSYTVHCCSNALASKFGSSIIFRRAAQPKPLVVQLILSRDICSATSENLSKILNIYGSRLRKNASKTAKIKAILKLDAVKNYISEQDAKDIEKKCDEMDVKRRARSANAEQDEDEDEEQPEAFEMNGEPDPALAAANELLALIGDDDEEEPADKPDAPEEAAAEELPAANRPSGEAETIRESRRGSCSASYNAELPKEQVDLALVEPKSAMKDKRRRVE